jgi:hypothetical protein
METWPNTDHEIGVMTVNCTNFRTLAPATGLDFDPAWRP